MINYKVQIMLKWAMKKLILTSRYFNEDMFNKKVKGC